MKDRKIIKALSKFSVYELNSFRKFLISPFFNQNEACIALFDFIKDALKSESNLEEISNEVIWKNVYGELPYVDLKLRKLFSDLFALFEEYITQKEFQQDDSQRLNLLMKAYTTRSLTELYDSLLKSIDANKKIQKNKDSLFYLNNFYIEKAIMNINLNDNNTISRKSELDKVINIEEASFNLDVFYIAEKLKSYCALLSYNQTYKLNKKIIGIDIILKLARSPFFKDYPPIVIYYLISQLKTDEDNIENFYVLKEMFLEHLHIFERKEAKDILDLILGYCITKSNKGNAEFDIEIISLYQKGLKAEIIFDRTMSPTTFRNITATGLKTGQLEWVEDFINEYSVFLEQSIRDSNVSFSMARLEGYRKNFKKVIGHLVNTEYTEVFQAILSRTLLLLSYYELEETESLGFLFNSFKLYLDREKSLTSQRKTPYYNLIKYTRTLLKLSSKDKAKLIKLKEEVEGTEWIVNKAWLLEKVEEKMK